MKPVTRGRARARPATSAGRFQGLEEIALRSDGLLAERIGARRLLGFRIERAWALAVGERVRSVTRLHECRDRTLVVDVTDIAWKRALEKLQPVILSRLAESLSDRPLEAISFRVRPSSRSTATSAPAPAPGAASAAHDVSPGGTLDDRLRRVMSRYLSRSAVAE